MHAIFTKGPISFDDLCWSVWPDYFDKSWQHTLIISHHPGHPIFLIPIRVRVDDRGNVDRNYMQNMEPT
jgi:hypothetical protein